MLETKKIIPVREQIAEQLRSDIISGDLAPDTKLNEQALASRFGVSRGPIRDVLLQLTKEGLLVTETNRGSSVNKVLSPELQGLMIEIRYKIEDFSIKQLKGNMTDEDFAALDNIIEQLGDAFDKEDYTELTKVDIGFHRYLVHRAGGDDLANLWYSIVMRMRMNYKRLYTPTECVSEHKAIVEALRENNGKAASAALKANIR